MKIWHKLLVVFLFAFLSSVLGVTMYAAKLYKDIQTTADDTYQEVERLGETRRETKLDYDQLEPVSILLLGVDTNDLRQQNDGDEGRSDSMIVVTINPKQSQTTLVSIPRDTIVELDTYYGDSYIGFDKINAAYAYGKESLAIKAVEDLLDIPIDHYATINMDGMINLVDAVGGVDVTNDIPFDLEGEVYDVGDLHLEGERAVKFARMRHADPRGDYGRQERQRLVLNKIFEKIASPQTLINYGDLLSVVDDNGKTDIDWNTIETLITSYTPALSSIVTDQITGIDYEGDGYYGLEGISYQMIDDAELMRVQNLLKQQLDMIPIET